MRSTVPQVAEQKVYVMQVEHTTGLVRCYRPDGYPDSYNIYRIEQLAEARAYADRVAKEAGLELVIKEIKGD